MNIRNSHPIISDTQLLLVLKSLIISLIQSVNVKERHRHRYEFNNQYKAILEDAGLVFSGINPQTGLVEIIEIPEHRWFVAGQFHPEFLSRPQRPQPLFRDFVKASIEYSAE